MKFDDIIYAFLYSVWIPSLERIKRFEHLFEFLYTNENIMFDSLITNFISKLCTCPWNESAITECGILKYIICKSKNLNKIPMKKYLKELDLSLKTKNCKQLI